MSVLFAKTQKGHEEIENKSGKLTPRVRRLLIFVDGKRTIEELRELLTADDLTHSLGLLEEENYIEVSSVTGTSSLGVVPSVVQPLRSITAFRPLHAEDQASLDKARNFMSNTINAFVGSTGTSTLIDNIQNASSHQDLRAVYDDWHYAIVSSRDGRREAESLRAKLLEVI